MGSFFRGYAPGETQPAAVFPQKNGETGPQAGT